LRLTPPHIFATIRDGRREALCGCQEAEDKLAGHKKTLAALMEPLMQGGGNMGAAIDVNAARDLPVGTFYP
jgi:hypothetical protein